jgi:Flp pilus assembly protein TadG
MVRKSLREAKLLFAKNTSGQAALMFGLAALPMMAGAGVAIDLSSCDEAHQLAAGN